MTWTKDQTKYSVPLSESLIQSEALALFILWGQKQVRKLQRKCLQWTNAGSVVWRADCIAAVSGPRLWWVSSHFPGMSRENGFWRWSWEHCGKGHRGFQLHSLNPVESSDRVWEDGLQFWRSSTVREMLPSSTVCCRDRSWGKEAVHMAVGKVTPACSKCYPGQHAAVACRQDPPLAKRQQLVEGLAVFSSNTIFLK